jgi:hypothetical protein
MEASGQCHGWPLITTTIVIIIIILVALQPSLSLGIF